MKKKKEKFYSTAVKLKNLASKDTYNYFSKESVFLHYSDFNTNWGDAVNAYLMKAITEKPVVSVKRVFDFNQREKIFGIGSILNTNLQNSVIWGSGFIKPPKKLITLPNKILAVRGKKTAAIFEQYGLGNNSVYGDPALLFPSLYKPKNTRKYKLGIVPHYTEVDFFMKNKKFNSDEIKIITPLVKNGDYLNIIDQISECENIASSSLHGLILADAYNIPSLRFTLSDKIIGGDFKYQDYYSGVGIDSFRTYRLKNINDFNINEVLEYASLKNIGFDGNTLKSVLLNHLNG